MGNPMLYIVDSKLREEARQQRFKRILEAYQAFNLSNAHLVSSIFDSLVTNREMAKVRIQYDVQKATQFNARNNKQDVIGSAWNYMSGPLPTRRIREKMKEFDQSIDNYGQTEEEIGNGSDADRRAYVQIHMQHCFEKIEKAQYNEAINLLEDLTEHVLICWESEDKYVQAFFESMVVMLEDTTSKQLIPAMLNASSRDNDRARMTYHKAKTVLYELWEHIGESKKKTVQEIVAPWMTQNKLNELGNPLHAAAMDNDAGMFVVLIAMGAPLDVCEEDVRNDLERKTAFEKAFDHFSFHPQNATVKAFVHYVDCQFAEIEKFHSLAGQEQKLETVKQRAAEVGSKAPQRSSKYQIVNTVNSQSITSPRIGLTKEGWFHDTKVEYRQENYGEHQVARTKILSALEANPFMLNQALNLLSKGEFKAFMYLKWLGRIESIKLGHRIADLYMKACQATGNTYLHFLVSHWDDPDYVCSNYERHMRLSAIVHVLSVCGDRARQATNKAGHTPWDLCRSDELKDILKYLKIDVSGKFLERIRSALTFQPTVSLSLPRHLTCDAQQFSEKVFEKTREFIENRNGEFTPLETELIKTVLEYIPKYIQGISSCDNNHHEPGQIIIMLQNKLILCDVREAYSVKDQVLSYCGFHYLNQLESLVDDAVLHRNIDAFGKQGILDAIACKKAYLERNAKSASIIEASKMSTNNQTTEGTSNLFLPTNQNTYTITRQQSTLRKKIND